MHLVPHGLPTNLSQSVGTRGHPVGCRCRTRRARRLAHHAGTCAVSFRRTRTIRVIPTRRMPSSYGPRTSPGVSDCDPRCITAVMLTTETRGSPPHSNQMPRGDRSISALLLGCRAPNLSSTARSCPVRREGLRVRRKTPLPLRLPLYAALLANTGRHRSHRVAFPLLRPHTAASDNTSRTTFSPCFSGLVATLVPQSLQLCCPGS